MSDPKTGARIAAIVRPLGLNLVGTAPLAAYDAVVPTARRLGAQRPASAVVLGHGGGAFWAAYRRHLAVHPEHAARADPLDDFTEELMRTRVLPGLRSIGLDGRLCLPFRLEETSLSFVDLAEVAGLGRRSLLGVLIHPEFGPWIALRGAVLVDAEISAPRPAAGFDPCGSCAARPCVGACPAGAVDRRGWNVPRCIDHRLQHPEDCRTQCDARVACVYGRAHVYPPDALRHHHTRTGLTTHPPPAPG